MQSNIESKLREFEEVITEIDVFADKLLSEFSVNISLLEQNLLTAIVEFDRLKGKASNLFQEAVNDLSSNDLVGIVKFAVKGLGALVNYGIAAWKKRKWLKQIVQDIETFQRKQEELITAEYNKFLFAKEKASEAKGKIVKQLELISSSLPPNIGKETQSYLQNTLNKSLNTWIKLSIIEGGALYLQTILDDIRARKYFSGNPQVWREHINSSSKEFTAKVKNTQLGQLVSI